MDSEIKKNQYEEFFSPRSREGREGRVNKGGEEIEQIGKQVVDLMVMIVA
jgi:hypothetical protein